MVDHAVIGVIAAIVAIVIMGAEIGITDAAVGTTDAAAAVKMGKAGAVTLTMDVIRATTSAEVMAADGATVAGIARRGTAHTQDARTKTYDAMFVGERISICTQPKFEENNFVSVSALIAAHL